MDFLNGEGRKWVLFLVLLFFKSERESNSDVSTASSERHLGFSVALSESKTDAVKKFCYCRQMERLLLIL